MEEITELYRMFSKQMFCGGRRNKMTYIFGLPLKTLVIVGGLFVISTLAPSITALILKRKKEWGE